MEGIKIAEKSQKHMRSQQQGGTERQVDKIPPRRYSYGKGAL